MESQFCDEHLDGMAKLFKSLPSVPRVVVPTVAAQVVEENPAEAIEHLVTDGNDVLPPGVQAVGHVEQPVVVERDIPVPAPEVYMGPQTRSRANRS